MEEEYKSRSQKKRESTALQNLGERLLRFSDKGLQALGLEGELLLALKEFKSLTKHEAKRRHLQYIGKLMRTVEDPAALLEKVAYYEKVGKKKE